MRWSFIYTLSILPFEETSDVTLNPFLMMLQTVQLGMELHKLDEPFRPREHIKVVQWKRSSSLPSARQRGCFLGNRVALVLMVSL